MLTYLGGGILINNIIQKKTWFNYNLCLVVFFYSHFEDLFDYSKFPFLYKNVSSSNI